LPRYRVIEKLYWRSTSNLALNGNVEALNLRRSFEKKIVAMYSQIFEYQMSMASHYAHSSSNRYLRDLVVPYDWQGMRAAILSKDRSIKDDLNVLDQTQLNAKLEEQMLLLEKASQDATSYFEKLLSTMNRVEKNITIREAKNESENREKEIMQALSSDYSDLKDITDDKVLGERRVCLNAGLAAKLSAARHASWLLRIGPMSPAKMLRRNVSVVLGPLRISVMDKHPRTVNDIPHRWPWLWKARPDAVLG
jgi:hypothetical protein